MLVLRVLKDLLVQLVPLDLKVTLVPRARLAHKAILGRLAPLDLKALLVLKEILVLLAQQVLKGISAPRVPQVLLEQLD